MAKQMTELDRQIQRQHKSMSFKNNAARCRCSFRDSLYKNGIIGGATCLMLLVIAYLFYCLYFGILCTLCNMGSVYVCSRTFRDER